MSSLLAAFVLVFAIGTLSVESSISPGNVCRSHLLQSGTLASPNYPGLYPNDSSTVWKLETDPGNFIIISFQSMNIIGPGDYLDIFDEGRFSIRYNNSVRPSPRVLGSTARLEFRTDVSGQGTGFAANFVFLSANSSGDFCGGDFRQSGSLWTPNHPGLYPNDIVRIWNLTTTPEKFIVLYFISMDLKGPGDYLDIFDEGRFFMRYNSSVRPWSIDLGSSVRLVFSSDGQKQGKGFKVSYAFRRPLPSPPSPTTSPVSVCGGDIRQPGFLRTPNYPGLYPNGVQCVWNLTMPSENLIILVFTSMDLKGPGDYLDIFNEGRFFARYSSSVRPTPRVLGSTGRLEFRTDGSGQGTGFEVDILTVGKNVTIDYFPHK